MTCSTSPISQPKLEPVSPQPTALGLQLDGPVPHRRTQDASNGERSQSLPELISAANRPTSPREAKVLKAALRAAATQVRRSKTTSSLSPKDEASNQERLPGSPPVTIAPQQQVAQPLASGPAAGLQQRPGTFETMEQINHRYTQLQANLPIYLIRTDLRYAPALDMVTVYMELPGLRLEDVNLRIGNRSNGIRHLIVTAVSRPPVHTRDEMAMQERIFGVFSRTLVVPPHVQVSAHILRVKHAF
jgi:HSP20 family molecular chaperone IbpA